MKLVTWNVNGIRARHAQLLDLAQKERPDVLCLQELKATPEQIPDPLTTLADHWSFWHGGPKGYSGVSLHLRKATFPDAPRFFHPPFDSEYRAVAAVAGGVTWASLYVPNGGKDFDAKMVFLRALVAWAAGVEGPLVIMGDLNVAREDKDVHPTQRKATAIGQREDERALFAELLGERLVDVGRAQHPDDERWFSWWPPWRNFKDRNFGWRIDYCLASPALAARVTSAEVHKDHGSSDHCPLVVLLDEPPPPKPTASPATAPPAPGDGSG